ncbi:hypothetical protein [Jiella sonneratiae]|uniref:Uncharacterized protein n=1 Tax=Jiella sonneratiae TaxID=2816856 RepID=A0ABS3J9Z0_9HYPH|nr:hypothetical protein [Jiella sonneratiae]MBO0906495.1 hypothetical protein [Jiella sonneratiae]
MRIQLRAAFLAATVLSLGALPAVAQSSGTSGEAGGDAQQNLVLPPDAAPKPMSPAETETPQKPAAAGGEASDATATGAPLGAAPAEKTSPAGGTGGTGDAAKPGAAANAGEAGQDGQPRNAVGDKFEMPHLTKENEAQMISELCGIQIKGMTPAACGCLGDRAVEKLTPPQRDYLIASVVAPPTADRLLKKGDVTKDDQKAIFDFLEADSASCKSAGSGANSGSGAPAGNAAPQGQGEAGGTK